MIGWKHGKSDYLSKLDNTMIFIITDEHKEISINIEHGVWQRFHKMCEKTK